MIQFPLQAMFAYHSPGGKGDDGERLALVAFDSPRFTCAKDAGDHIVLGNPDWGVIVACEQAQYGKSHIRTATRGAGRNHFGTRPATADGIERQSQICIVLVGVVAFNFKVGGGIDQRTARVAHRVGISYIYVAAQTGAQQRVEPAVRGDNVVALPY